MLAGEAFSQLTHTDDFVVAYKAFKTKAWAVIESSNDSVPYTTDWNLINFYAQSSLAEFSQGNVSALNKLKEQLKISIELMP